MSRLSERLSSTTYKTTRLDICIDGELRDERDRILREVAEARDAAKVFNKKVKDGEVGERLAAPSEIEEQLERALAASDDVDARIGDALITIEVSALPGNEWASIKYKRTIGEKPTPMDRQMGCNTEAATIDALLSRGAFIDGDERHPLSATDVEKLRSTITEGDFDRIKVAVLQLNQKDGYEGVGHLKVRSSVTPADASN